MPSVLQPWTEELSFKKQTVLLGAIRSPDTLFTLRLKQLTIWIRGHVLQNADPLTGFMHPLGGGKLPLFEQVDREFERLPLHAAHHILLALQVIGWEHPGEGARLTARKFYDDAVYAQHLCPEPHDQYEARYTDNVNRVEDFS